MLYDVVALIRSLAEYAGSELYSKTSDQGITIYFTTSSFSDIKTTDTVLIDALQAFCKTTSTVIEADYITTTNDKFTHTVTIDVNDDVFELVFNIAQTDEDIVTAMVSVTIEPKYVAYFLNTRYE